MCSKFSVTSDPDEVQNAFHYINPANFPRRDNIRPTEPVMIVREANANRRELALVRWGLIPHWVKDPDDFTLIINARAETLMEKPSFRTSVAHKRCLFPANAFYEWSGPKGNRTPHLITMKQQKEQNDASPPLMAFAGLWDHWLGADGSEFESAVIITVAANEEMSQIHQRMPAILKPEHYDAWLDVKNIRAKEVLPLLAPAESNSLTINNLESLKEKPAPKKATPQDDPSEQGSLF